MADQGAQLGQVKDSFSRWGQVALDHDARGLQQNADEVGRVAPEERRRHRDEHQRRLSHGVALPVGFPSLRRGGVVAAGGAFELAVLGGEFSELENDSYVHDHEHGEDGDETDGKVDREGDEEIPELGLKVHETETDRDVVVDVVDGVLGVQPNSRQYGG